MQDSPDAAELAGAVAGFLREEVLPQLSDPRLQFRLRVAINGVRMLEREAQHGSSVGAEVSQAIAQALGMPSDSSDPTRHGRSLQSELARRIRTAQPPDDLLPLLRRLVELKLAIVGPATRSRYPRAEQRGRQR